METKTKLIAAAERLFDANGFTATGIDRLTEAADMSSRTLYKHAGSKTRLIVAVLIERDHRFFRQFDTVGSVEALFDALDDWIQVEGARGCLYLRALGETGGSEPEITAVIQAHKQRLRQRIADIVTAEIGTIDDALTEEILVLFEGATAASVYRGQAAIRAARQAGGRLVAAACRS